MKTRYTWVLLLALLVMGCDDNTGSIGLEMFPSSDLIINGQKKNFDVTTVSKQAKDVYAKTSIGYLGKFTDPFFGFYEASFLTEIHCYEGFKMPQICDPNNEEDRKDPAKIMVKDESYRTELVLYYTKYFGDSLTASHVSVYELNKELDKNEVAQTNINPKEYYSPEGLIGECAYTAVDLSIDENIRKKDGYVPYIIIQLDNKIGNEIVKKSRECEKNGQELSTVFKDILKGVYLKNDYGDGTILYVDQIELRIVFESFERDKDSGEILKKKAKNEEGKWVETDQDSIAYKYRSMAYTREVLQANSMTNNETKIQERIAEDKCTYIKTPSGIYTQATLPLLEIENELKNDTLNVVTLSMVNYDQAEDANQYAFPLGAPQYLLLLREQDKDAFFKENKLNDNITSIIASHNALQMNRYVFSNLSQLIITCLKEKDAAKEADKTKAKKMYEEEGKVWDENVEKEWEKAWPDKNSLWNKVAIVPVNITTSQSGQGSVQITSIQNSLEPGYVKLFGGPNGDKLKLEITYTSFD